MAETIWETGLLWGLDLQTSKCVTRLRELKQHLYDTRKERARTVNTIVSSEL